MLTGARRSAPRATVRSVATTDQRPCSGPGGQHRWKEMIEWYSHYSTQEAGRYWLCLSCRKRSEEKPSEWRPSAGSGGETGAGGA